MLAFPFPEDFFFEEFSFASGIAVGRVLPAGHICMYVCIYIYVIYVWILHLMLN